MCQLKAKITTHYPLIYITKITQYLVMRVTLVFYQREIFRLNERWREQTKVQHFSTRIH